MSRGVNKVILVGRLGQDVDLKYTQGGMAVAKVSMATATVRKDRDGNQQEKTEWHRLTFFGKLAEIAGEYLRKGSQAYVEGRISYSETSNDDGTKRYYTDIIVDEMQMLGGNDRGNEGGGERRQSGGQRRDERGDDRGRSSGNDRGQSGNGNGGGARSSAPRPARREPAMAESAFKDDYSDDIPFAGNRGMF